MNKMITQEALCNLSHAIALLQMDAQGMVIPDVIDIFGETNNQAEQVRQAKNKIARFAETFCS